MGTSTCLDSRFSLVECSEGILGIVRRQKPGEPSRDALPVGRPPLGGPCFPGDFDSLHSRLVGGSQPVACDAHKCLAKFIPHLRSHGNLIADAVGIGRDHLVVDGLDLENEARLVEEPAIGDHAHGLGHLERADEDIALPDREIRDIATLECALVHAEHVVVVRDVSGGLGAQGNAGAAAEAEALGVVDNRRGAYFQACLIEPGIAGLGERLLKGEAASINFFPVSKSVVTYGE